MKILVRQKKFMLTQQNKMQSLILSMIIFCLFISNISGKSIKSEHCLKHHHSCKLRNYKAEVESQSNFPDSIIQEKSEEEAASDSLSSGKKDESPMETLNSKSSFISVATKSLQERDAPKLCCKENPKITLTGSANTALKTDLIRIGIQVDTKRPNAQQALQINTQTANAITNALIANGVLKTDMSTINFSLTPQYIFVPDTNSVNASIQKFDGYLVSNFIDVKTNKVNLAGKIIDLAVENGAKMINYVNFEILPETMETAKKVLIKSAVEDALQKAKEVLDPLNHEVSEISSINLSQISPVFTRIDGEVEGKAMAAVAGSTPPVVFNNEREVSANVNVVFLIEKKAAAAESS